MRLARFADVGSSQELKGLDRTRKSTDSVIGPTRTNEGRQRYSGQATLAFSLAIQADSSPSANCFVILGKTHQRRA